MSSEVTIRDIAEYLDIKYSRFYIQRNEVREVYYIVCPGIEATITARDFFEEDFETIINKIEHSRSVFNYENTIRIIKARTINGQPLSGVYGTFW
jgi:hypothetical protein